MKKVVIDPASIRVMGWGKYIEHEACSVDFRGDYIDPAPNYMSDQDPTEEELNTETTSTEKEPPLCVQCQTPMENYLGGFEL